MYNNAYSTSYAALGGTSYVYTNPGVVDGQAMVVQASWDGSGGGVTPPAGWTPLLNLDNTVDANTSRVYWKIAAGEGASWTWINTAQSSGRITLYAFDGRSALVPTAGVKQNEGGGGGVDTPATVTALGVTAAQGDDIIMLTDLDVVTDANVWGFSAYSGGLTKRTEVTDSHWLWDSGATIDNVNAGATGNYTCTITRTSGIAKTGWCTGILALAAAAADGSYQSASDLYF